jgi:hypothetical protein
MWFSSWLRNPKRSFLTRQVRTLASSRHMPPRCRLWLEALEDRTLLSGVAFNPPLTFPVQPNSFLAVGDFNGDGKPDLVVNTGQLLLGNGDGTFQPARSISAPFGQMVVGDFNGDGKADLAAIAGNNTIRVLLGNGDGTFQAPQSFAVGSFPEALAVGDFNGDGKLDLAVVNNRSNNVSVLLGNGDGTFQPAQNIAVGIGPQSLAVGDFNGDGKLDLAVGLGYGAGVSVLLGNGDGTFQAPQTFGAGSAATSLAVADFNGDGKLDLAVTTNWNFNGTVGVLLGNGDGTFQPVRNFAAGNFPGSLTVADFNGDGIPDLAAVEVNGGTASVLLGNGDGSFQPPQTFVSGGAFAFSLAVGDFNGDGKPDLAIPADITPVVSVLLNALPTTTALNGPATSTYAQSVTYQATVTSNGAPVNGGTVTFMEGNTPLTGALPVNASGQASFSISTLNAGSYTITASYSGTPGGARTTGYGTSP